MCRAQATRNMHAQAAALLHPVGHALGAAPHGLASLTDKLPLPRGAATASVLRACHYPAGAAAGAGALRGGDGRALPGSEAEQEMGLVTLVFADTAEGLEVQSPSSGAWQRASVPPGCMALLPGLSLERATAGAVRAAVHRVVRRARSRGSSLVGRRPGTALGPAVWCSALIAAGRERHGTPARPLQAFRAGRVRDQHPSLPRNGAPRAPQPPGLGLRQ